MTHIAPDGSVHMVDVGAKPPTQRVAIAEATVQLSAAALRALQAGTIAKGDALTTAQIAGIAAAKRTSDLIPLCHPLQLTHVDVSLNIAPPRSVLIRCEVACLGPTGVEMEALTGVAVAALTLYDMCKAVDRRATIQRMQLVEKRGGKSGVFKRRRG